MRSHRLFSSAKLEVVRDRCGLRLLARLLLLFLWQQRHRVSAQLKNLSSLYGSLHVPSMGRELEMFFQSLFCC